MNIAEPRHINANVLIPAGLCLLVSPIKNPKIADAMSLIIDSVNGNIRIIYPRYAFK